MNGRIAKKIRQVNRRNWREYIKVIYALPLRTRLLYAWHIIIKY